MASTPSPDLFNQRTLAAIVFTDVVGFSARMQVNEVATIKLLQRDFAEMRRVCADHEGEVLKTTGDGLLMKFNSAVHAVASALVMQRQFAAEAKELPPGGPLQHRIGIHLGDVLVQDQDVMGDGVNIASRLQAEAEPGGICISQTVYDVVKNKLELHAVSLGPRDLKNISQSVPAYRLLMEAQALSNSRPPMPARSPGEPAAQKAGTVAAPVAPRSKLIPATIAILAAAVVVAAIILRPAAPTTNATPTPGTPPPATGATAVAAETAPRSPEEEALETEFARRKEMLQARIQYLDKYDFDGYARALRDQADVPASARAAQQAMVQSLDLMGVMKDWLKVSLQRYNRQKPLLVHDLSGDPSKDTSVFLSPDRRLVYIENNAPTTPIDWPEVKPTAMAALVVTAIKDIKQAQTREVIMGAQAFARIYNIPSMKDALPALPGLRAGGAQGQAQGRVGAGQGQLPARAGQGQGLNRGRAGADSAPKQ